MKGPASVFSSDSSPGLPPKPNLWTIVLPLPWENQHQNSGTTHKFFFGWLVFCFFGFFALYKEFPYIPVFCCDPTSASAYLSKFTRICPRMCPAFCLRKMWNLRIPALKEKQINIWRKAKTVILALSRKLDWITHITFQRITLLPSAIPSSKNLACIVSVCFTFTCKFCTDPCPSTSYLSWTWFIVNKTNTVDDHCRCASYTFPLDEDIETEPCGYSCRIKTIQDPFHQCWG